MLTFNNFCNINNHLYKSPKSDLFTLPLSSKPVETPPRTFPGYPTRMFPQAPNCIHQLFPHTTLSWLTPDQPAEMETWEELASTLLYPMPHNLGRACQTSPFSPYYVHPVFVAFCLASFQNHPADGLQVADCLQDEAVISQRSDRQEEAIFYPRMVVLTSYVSVFTQLTNRLSASPFFSDFNIFFTKFLELCKN